MTKHTLKVSKEESMGKLYEWSNYYDDYVHIGKYEKDIIYRWSNYHDDYILAGSLLALLLHFGC